MVITCVHGGSIVCSSSSSSSSPLPTLVQCHGDDSVFGIVRGPEIEVIRVSLNSSSSSVLKALEVVGTSVMPSSSVSSSVSVTQSLNQEDAARVLKIDSSVVPVATTLLSSKMIFMESPWYANDNDNNNSNDDDTSIEQPYSLERIHANSRQMAIGSDDNSTHTIGGGVHMIKDSDSDRIHIVALGVAAKRKDSGSRNGSSKTPAATVSYLYSGYIVVMVMVMVMVEGIRWVMIIRHHHHHHHHLWFIFIKG